ncbi:hypothetical protein ATO7_06170 [Oceanococcus atlanticus]|uniref:Uncharacterized protein n=1 Tax=Oceanococcus atlanticus TaxID=1317117 RepID=A0A1Y1SIE2_9GAMM|nr:hypothetical protein [Oceanococcus atlanticus]ORE89443.1 hypothetical protein ATO7_06170 [Oceanococcus atlanticus]
MATDIEVVLLGLGLLGAVWYFARRRSHLQREDQRPSGVFGIVCGLMSVFPLVLMKLNLIAQTTTTMMLGILYFLVFILGSMLVYSKANRICGGGATR